MRDVVKPGIVLFLLTAVVSLLLAVAQAGAAPAIETNARVAKEKALSQVLPIDDLATKWGEFDVNEGGIVSYSVAANTEGTRGWAITAETRGYGGTMAIMVGIDTSGKITGVSILSHNETPGLGANAPKPAFIGQYAGKGGGLTVVKQAPQNDTEIQAITASTITSKAVTSAVNSAYAFYEANLKGGATTSE